MSVVMFRYFLFKDLTQPKHVAGMADIRRRLCDLKRRDELHQEVIQVLLFARAECESSRKRRRQF